MENVKKDNNQSVIRGASAIFILLTHITAYTNPDCIFRVFTSYGYLCVGLFFFYSGFNLINSYMNKDNFFSKFWFRKITRIYLPLIISNILFVFIQYYLNKETISFYDMFYYIFGIKAINGVNWYIYAIIIFYFVSYCILFILNKIQNIRKNKKALLISSILIFLIYGKFYLFIASKLHLTTSIENIYPFTLIIGMIYCLFKERIVKLLNNKNTFEMIFFLFFISCILHYAMVNKINISFITPQLIGCLVPTFFTVSIELISLKVQLYSKFCMFIDSISLEAYAFHYVILNLFSNKVINFKNNYIYLVVYLITVLIISYCTNNGINFLFYRSKQKEIIKVK